MNTIFAAMGAAQPSQVIVRVCPRLQATERRLRDIEADLDVARRQHARHRAARRHPVADDVVRVVHESRRGRRDDALRQSPCALRDHLAGRPGIGLGGADLVGARRHLRRRHDGLELLDAGFVASGLRPGVVESGAADEAAGEELLLALHVRRRQLAHRARLLQLLGGGLDFGRPLAAAQVGEARLGRREPLPGLAARGGLVLPLQREQRRPGGDLIATLHRKLGERAGERRRDAHVFAFDVSLQRPRAIRPAAGDDQDRGYRRERPGATRQYLMLQP